MGRINTWGISPNSGYVKVILIFSSSNMEKKDWEVDTRIIVPPSFYKELKKHKYNMKKYIKSKLIKLTTK